MSIEIRPLAETDVPAIHAIETIAHLAPWSESLIRSNFGKRYQNFGLFDGHELVGYYISSQVVDEVTLLNIAISPKQQGKQLGKQLMAHLVQRCEEGDVSQLWLEVRVSNQAAIHLYQSAGFCEVDRRANYYPAPGGGREDASVMCLQLGWKGASSARRFHYWMI